MKTRDNEIKKIEKQIAKILAKAERDCIKYDDCGPMDTASEEVEELEEQIKTLKSARK